MLFVSDKQKNFVALPFIDTAMRLGNGSITNSFVFKEFEASASKMAGRFISFPSPCGGEKVSPLTHRAQATMYFLKFASGGTFKRPNPLPGDF